MKTFLCLIAMAMVSLAYGHTTSVVIPTDRPRLDKIGTSFFIFLPLVNSGTATGDNVAVTAATLGTLTPSSPAFPFSLGTLASVASNAVTQ